MPEHELVAVVAPQQVVHELQAVLHDDASMQAIFIPAMTNYRIVVVTTGIRYSHLS